MRRHRKSMNFNRLLPRYAAPLASETIEFGPGGLPIVQMQGLNTNQVVNFSGFQVDTSGNVTTPGAITATGGITNAGGAVTGPTGSFANLNVTTAEVTGATGTTATLIPVGAAAGGPTTTAQDGWMKMKIAGTQVWVPVWK